MAEEVVSQWVVRLPDSVVRLQRPLRAMVTWSTAAVLQYKSRSGIGVSQTRIERQYDANTLREDVQFEYWILLFPFEQEGPLDVLCCTVQRATADRIIDELWRAMFTNCGDNTFVDLRELLAADLVTPEQLAATPVTGRFVDLGDSVPQRPAAAAGSVDTAAVPVQTIPTRLTPQEESPSRALSQWIRTANFGGSSGRANANGDIFVTGSVGGIGADIREAPQEVRSTANLHNADIERRWATPAELAAISRQSTVPNIGRGTERNDNVLTAQDRERINRQISAALLRQRPENRNTREAPLAAVRNYSDYVQPAAVGVQYPPDNDAVDRVDPEV